jgi:3-hydroxyisobutyrate dehydrogenase-like beta-hydroxyacid dehydrogenase
MMWKKLFGENGLIAKGRQGALFIDMTTSSPALARRIAVAAKNAGMAALDAPVSGGDVGAREARLAIMVGGEQGTLNGLSLFLTCWVRMWFIKERQARGSIRRCATNRYCRQYGWRLRSAGLC